MLINSQTNPVLLGDDQHYATVLPSKEANGGYWHHIAIVAIGVSAYKSGAVSYLTGGLWDVDDIVGYSKEQNKL